MDISKIRENYNNGYYNAPHTEPMIVLPADHVFDENLSVRANREMVEEHNKKCDEQRRVRQAVQNSLVKQLRNDVIAYIIEAYDLTKPQAELVEGFVYSEYHAFMCDYFSNIDDIADFADDLIRLCGDVSE